MAQSTTIACPVGEWTELTDGDVTNITFQVKNAPVEIKATTASAPTDFDGSIRYQPGQGESNVVLLELFAGSASADRLWAYATDRPASVSVSNA